MPFLENLREFLRTAPENGEEAVTGRAAKLLAGGQLAAGRVVAQGRAVEVARGLPAHAITSAVMSSGRWRAGLPQKDGMALSLVRDLLVAKGQFPQVRGREVFLEADPVALGEAIGEVARLARRQLVSYVLRTLVAEAGAARATPRELAQELEDRISATPRIFKEGDLVYRLVKLVQ